MRTGILKNINLFGLFSLLSVAFSMAVIIAGCYLYNGWWGIEILTFLIPPVILLNLLLFILCLRKKKLLFLAPLSVVLLAIKPIDESFAFNFKKDTGKSDLRVMSYNIGLFNPDRFMNAESNISRNAGKYKWLREHQEPDILCIQEFFHSESHEYEMSLDSIVKAGNYTYFYINPFYDPHHKGIYGVITFSKFPALRSGELKYGESTINRGVWNDFVIKGDTVRILNFHLQSMSIRVSYDRKKSIYQNFKNHTAGIYRKLEQGYKRRKEELQIIEDFIDQTPYRIIICADLNALPYSYTYQRLKKRFGNAFEDAGTGFGFTYLRFPWFIRIDNQFYDRRLQADYFKTHHKLKISDHYPVEAGYSFPHK
jgi:endonuclease/exonuclease/phosphatase family metal-dependent hydrolase